MATRSEDTVVNVTDRAFDHKFTWRTDKVMHKQLRGIALDRDLPLTQLINDILDDFVATHPLTGHSSDEGDDARADHAAMKHRVTTWIRSSTHEHLKRYAYENDITIAGIVNSVLRDFITK